MAGVFDIASQSNAGVLNGYSYGGSISASGVLLAFDSYDPVSGYNQIYVKNEQTSALTLISQAGGVPGNGTSFYPTISADGSTIGFDSYASNLGVPGALDEVYVKNILNGSLQLVSQTSTGVTANGQSEYAALSSDGHLVAFDSNASNLGLGATGASKEIYVKNTTTGALTLVSQTATGTLANSDAYSQSISADGNIVVFYTNATDLGSTGGTNEVYAKNVATGALAIASQTSGGTIANANAQDGSVSADGTLVAFDSTATNLVAGATGGNAEAYLKNLTTGDLTLISSKADGTVANGNSDTPVLSADGRFAIFESTATNLDPAAVSGISQVYAKNLQTGALTLLSKDATGTAGNAASTISYPSEQAFSANDAQVTFATLATNLAGPVGMNAEIVRDTVDIVPPTVTFDQGVTFSGPHRATLSGTVSDASGPVANVEVYNGAKDLGAAKVAADGTWHLRDVRLPSGNENLSVTATDPSGNVSPHVDAPFVLQVGLQGLPYSSYEEDFDANGNYTGDIYTTAQGAVYLNDYVEKLASGNQEINYDSGTFFDTQSYYFKSDVFSPDFSVQKSETLFNDDGTHDVTGFTNGAHLQSVHDDTMTAFGHNTVFAFGPGFGQDTITNFAASGPGHDKIALSSARFASAQDVLNNTKDVNGNAVIQVGQSTITLDGVSKAMLGAQDFKFHT